MKRLPTRRPRGVALLLAVLLTALAALIAFSILDAQAVALQRTHALSRGAQLDEFARGVEAIATIALRRDAAQEPGVDHNGDVWHQPLLLELPRGRLVARMRDLNGCFNLNALASSDPALATEAWSRLQRLLRALKLDPALADAIADYVDADRNTRDSGAEDLRYLGGRPASRSADRAMAHVSELRSIMGLDAQSYARLAGETCALAINSPINVNTASVAVLRALSEDIDPARANGLVAEGNARRSAIQEFLDELERAGVAPPNIIGLGVKSDEFLLESEIEYDGVTVAYWTQFARRDERVRVNARGRGRYQ